MENTVTPTAPENTEQAFSGQGTGQPDADMDATNPLEGFFRANGIEEEESADDPFAMTGVTEDTVNVVEPQTQQQPEAQEEKPQDNDEKRYQYWQSEADRARNENAQLAQRLQALEQQANQPQPDTGANQEEDDSFPPPPPKPAKPRSYTRAEAMEDPTSESAKYMEDVDDWRNDMDDYNRLHAEYNTALVKEERDKISQERDNILRAQADRQARVNQMSEIQSHLRNNYQASDEEIKQFVTIMDKPESVNLDNLFKLFRLQTGNQPTVAPVDAPKTETAPADSFDQMKRAQQVPTSMGVLPSQGNTGGNPEDNMMDSMIGEFKNRNPWGN